MVFSLSEHGIVFSTRPRGRELREALLASLSADEPVTISFESVIKVSQSFSDEFLGALISELGSGRIRVVGVTVPAVERVLNRALHHRGFASVKEIGAVAA